MFSATIIKTLEEIRGGGGGGGGDVEQELDMVFAFILSKNLSIIDTPPNPCSALGKLYSILFLKKWSFEKLSINFDL